MDEQFQQAALAARAAQEQARNSNAGLREDIIETLANKVAEIGKAVSADVPELNVLMEECARRMLN